MEMLENEAGQKRRMPKLGTMVLAAALAVGFALSIAAGLPAQVYNFVTGGTATVLPGTDQVFFEGGFTGAEDEGPVVVENGRLWFQADGQKLDITDQVDENTPYIYEHTDPATGNKGYLVVGGTVDDFGWVELTQMDNATAIGGSNFAEAGVLNLEDRGITPVEGEDGLYHVVEDGAEGGECQIVETGDYRPWFRAALAQLDLDVELGLTG